LVKCYYVNTWECSVKMNIPEIKQMNECKHKWEIKEEHIINSNLFFFKKVKEKVIVLQCKRCGNIIKKFIPLGTLK